MHSGSFATKNVLAFEHRFFQLLTMFIKEIHVYLSNKARSTIRHTFTKERELSAKRGGGSAPWAHP